MQNCAITLCFDAMAMQVHSLTLYVNIRDDIADKFKNDGVTNGKI